MRFFKELRNAPEVTHGCAISVRLMARAWSRPALLSKVRAMQARDSPLRDARAARNSYIISRHFKPAAPCDYFALDSSGALS